MKNGVYKISLEVELTGMESTEEAIEAITNMLLEMQDNEEVPQMEFELLQEGPEQEYLDEEDDGVEEVDFADAC